ncbi:fructosamine kinase [Trypanosoma rangeli]|uniref:protein-ribulosamine 3-kinase n=1 Tax=Trypanosoma rangeli TaxID=5698 RepID=A0A422NXG7_TRYRA|nr:fructosamine kinase [Trypanosoma rangeli]RNF10232.1 fructosamine kinase [Trypanosoma rangeli]|eukprot:RNF10232.1 fructosamine kinase [Trypanosoma rangeli]
MTESLEETFSRVLSAKVARAKRVFGGDINETYRLEMEEAGVVYFLKLQRGTTADFYAAESMGLSLLSAVARTPRVVQVGEVNGWAYLIMMWIQSAPHGCWGAARRNLPELGRMLAKVHRQTSPNGQFGSSVPIGLAGCETPAGWSADWAAYYIDCLLEPRVALAQRKGYWSGRRQEMFALFSSRFRAFYASRKQVQPSLLHGDLWGGNVMYGEAGEPYLIDPSSFYGHREVDLAMTQLFGGFGCEFYAAYEAEMPLEAGHESRVPWYQVFPLLNHLNLFGEAYGHSLDRALAHTE